MLKNQLVAELFQERFWKLPRGLMCAAKHSLFEPL